MANLIEQVQVELENINFVVNELDSLAAGNFRDKYHIQAAALLLHNFYNGLENILKHICKNYNIKIPNSENWHKQLLAEAVNAQVITAGLAKKLLVYLRFRHFVSHSYSFRLDLELFMPLIKDVGKTFNLFKKAISKYMR